MLSLNKIYNMDCRDGLAQLETECIDLVITSPLYNEIRDYQGAPGGLMSKLATLWSISTFGATNKTNYEPIGQGLWQPTGSYVGY